MAEKKWKAVEVEAYAGFEADERPMFVGNGDSRSRVQELLEIWHEEDAKAGHRRKLFKVKLQNGIIAMVCHDETDGTWWIKEPESGDFSET